MFIFNNLMNGRSHQVEACKVGSLDVLLAEASRTLTSQLDFKLKYYDDSGKPVPVDTEDFFKKIKERDHNFFVFDLVSPEAEKPVPATRPPNATGAPGQLEKATSQSERNILEAIVASGAPFMRKIDDVPTEFTVVYNGESPEPHEAAQPPVEFHLVDSKMGKSSFGTMSQLEFNQIVSQNETIKQVNESIQDLESEMRMAMEELKLGVSQAQASPTDSLKKERVLEIHKGVRCDVCQRLPIRGKRFKCLVCRDFDLCMSCERTHNHVHPMLRLTSPFPSSSVNFLGQAAQLKYSFDKMTEPQRRKCLLKFFAGRNYEEMFYDQFLAKNSELSFLAFVTKVAQIFS